MRYCEEANKIAKESNQLVEKNMIYKKEKDKQELINEIIKKIVDNWVKNGGAIDNILSQ